MKFHDWKKYCGRLGAVILTASLLLSATGCSASASAAAGSSGTEESDIEASVTEEAGSKEGSSSADTKSESSLAVESSSDVDEKDAVTITLSGSKASVKNASVGQVSIEDGLVTIKDGGVYILTGSFTGRIRIKAEESDTVQLILKDADISSDSAAAIFGKKAKEIILTLEEGTVNTITGQGEDEDNSKIDAAVYVKCDLTINGQGDLTVNGEDDLHAIVSKGDITVVSGNLTLSSGEDGLNAGNDITVSDGNLTIDAGDDGIHADGALVIDGGTIDITNCYEGLEGLTVTVNDGTITLNASDDGVNATEGKNSSSTDAQQGAGGMDEVQENAAIIINGGSLTATVVGDGLDSNGNLQINGGNVVIIGPEGQGDGSLDYNGTGTISGGTILAAGSSGMAQGFTSDSTQASILVVLSGTYQAGSQVEIKDSDSNTLASQTIGLSYNCIVFSSPDLTEGDTYTVYVDGEEAGSGEAALSSDQGMGGQMGGPMGGQPGGQNGFPGGQNGQSGSGTPPQMPGQGSNQDPGQQSSDEQSSDGSGQESSQKSSQKTTN